MKPIYLSPPGLVCCAGRDIDELYKSCITGNRNGIVMREIAGAGTFPTGLAPEMPAPAFKLPEPDIFTNNTKIIRLIDAALEQIRGEVERAAAKYGHEKIGVCLGSCDNGSEASILAHREFFTDGTFPADYKLRFQSASLPAEFAAAKFGLKGPCFTIATACASGASAIIRGAELIRSGVCGAVIAGGADIVSDTVLLGFNALEAVSKDLTNPFSKNRNGINLGEGAAFFLLDSSPDLSGVRVTLLGYGESSDANHMTAPSADGEGAAKAMRAALASAGIESDSIDYVNLHGTGTPLNDIAEAKAMNAVFKGRAVPASSTKPVTGHTLGAAGALETAICRNALREMSDALPVHCWDGEKDEELPFNPSPSTTDCAKISGAPSICMNNNFAFGGCNVSLILKRET